MKFEYQFKFASTIYEYFYLKSGTSLAAFMERIVWLCILTEQYDLALDWIETGWESRDPDQPYIFTGSELYDPISDHPRYIKVAQEMGLPLK